MNTYDVEVRNLSTGECRIVSVNANDAPAAISKALRRKDLTDEFHKAYLFTFRVEFRA